MTTKHTPGPWTEHDGFIVGKFNDGKVRDVCDPRCAPAEKYLLGEMDANAKLIAAAPDLLAALIEMCEGWPAQKPGSPHFDTYCKARQAIEKATL